MSAEVETTAWTEWGVRFGDGEIDYDYMRRDLAEEWIAEIRADIASGKYEADDYEPMAVVMRDVTQDVACDWTVVS